MIFEPKNLGGGKRLLFSFLFWNFLNSKSISEKLRFRPGT